MTLPLLEKSWTFDTNNIVDTGWYYNNDRQLLYEFKNWFVSVGWTIKGSCDSVTSGMDGVDRWTDVTKLVWGHNAKSSGLMYQPSSWVVLKAPAGLSPTLELMIQCWNDSKYNPTFWSYHMLAQVSWHAAGFSGGDIYLNPTATNSVTLINGDQDSVDGMWRKGYNNSSIRQVWHAMAATDGSCFRVIVSSGASSGGGNTVLWLFEKAKSSPITDPSIAAVCRGERNVQSTYDNWCKNYPPFCHNSTGVATTVYPTVQMFGATPNAVGYNIQVPNDIGGGLWMGPMGLAASAGVRGYHGYIPDLWWGTRTSYGQTSGNKTFVQFHDVVFPWDGSTPVTQ